MGHPVLVVNGVCLPAESLFRTLTQGSAQAIVEPSGVREGGANPPLPRNCKRRELEPIC